MGFRIRFAIDLQTWIFAHQYLQPAYSVLGQTPAFDAVSLKKAWKVPELP